ncbi:MAG: hypothetical protein MUO82_10865 [Candidatus Thermoplasmatota archaeon]|nr:hypothetical protein [Candidatus Thermoplasmatota archaeon]
MNKKIKNMFLISLIIELILLTFSYSAMADITSNLSPSATGSYKNEWTNPTNAYSQNNVYATCQPSGATTNEQDYYNFGITTTCMDDITDIKIYIDAYCSAVSIEYFTIKLSWDGGTTWTSTQNTPAIGTTDTNTYVSIGGLWGRSWSLSELSNANFRVYLLGYTSGGIVTIYFDHIYLVVTFNPIVIGTVTELKSYNGGGCNIDAHFNWIKGTNSDYTRIQYSTVDYPTTISSGTNLCNTTNNYYDIYDLNPYTTYYFSAWAYSSTCKKWAGSYDTVYFNSPCSRAITVINNTAHTTGKYTTKTYPTTGNYIWLNYTGAIPPLTDYQNIVHATGTHQYSFDSTNWLYKDWANYTGDTPTITQYENIVNATGTHQYSWSSSLWKFYDWANYTGDTTPIKSINVKNLFSSVFETHKLYNDGWYFWFNSTGTTTPIMNYYENFVNATGTLESQLLTDGVSYRYYNIFGNVTGNKTICPTCNSTALTITNNNINITGNYGSSYNNISGWYLWLNYTGKPTYLNLFENIINATGTHQFNLITNTNNFTYSVWANYTGLGGGSCGFYFINYSDENITYNVSLDCSSGVNTSSYKINESNWLSLMFGTILFDNSQFGIIIQLIVFFILIYMSFKIDPMEGKSFRGHVIPFIGGLYLLFAGIDFIGMTTILSIYLNSYIISFLVSIGIVLCILGVFKAFYYKS